MRASWKNKLAGLHLLGEVQLDEQLAALDKRLAFEASFDAQLANLDQRMDAQAKALEAQQRSRLLSQKPPEKQMEKEKENEPRIERGFGLGR